MTSQTFQLVMKSGPTPRKVFSLEKNEVHIGRDISSHILINDAEVSRRHARLILQAGGYVIEDLGSTNGTFVNGQRLVGLRTLRPGDTMTLGENLSLIFEVVQPDSEATRLSTPAPPAPVQPPRAVSAIPPLPGRPPELAVEESVEVIEEVSELPLETPPAAKAKKGLSRNWLIAGCGCLSVLCLIALALLWYIDANYLWCRVLPFLPGCP